MLSLSSSFLTSFVSQLIVIFTAADFQYYGHVSYNLVFS